MVETEQRQKTRNNNLGKDLLSFFVTLAAVLVFVWLLKTFVYQAYNIPSGSMEETIVPGDMIFAEKVTYYFREPQQGDILTFRDTQDPTGQKVLIKRVIATGGQTVNIADGHVVIDGVALTEPYVQGTTAPLASYDVSYPYKVPEGYIWVMGDNRQYSVDSRAFGAVPLDNVLEHAVLVYWPFDHFGSLYAGEE